MKNNKENAKTSKVKNNILNMFLEKYIDTLYISGSEKEIKKFKKNFIESEQEKSFMDMLLNIEKDMGGKSDGFETLCFDFFNKTKTSLNCEFHPLSINPRDLLKVLGDKFPELKFMLVHTISLLSRTKIGFENGAVVTYDDNDKYEDKGQCMNVCVRRY